MAKAKSTKQAGSYQERSLTATDPGRGATTTYSSLGDTGNQYMSDYQKVLDAGLAAGKTQAEALVPAGTFGKVDEARAQETTDYLNKLKSLSESGITGQEAEAQRAAMYQNINQATQGNLRQLRGIQGAQGLQGAAAAAQQSRQLREGAAQKAQAERDIFLKSQDVARGALSQYGSAMTQAQADELARKQFNISQDEQDFLSKLGIQLGTQQQAVAGFTGGQQAQATQQYQDYLNKLAEQDAAAKQAKADKQKADEEKAKQLVAQLQADPLKTFMM